MAGPSHGPSYLLQVRGDFRRARRTIFHLDPKADARHKLGTMQFVTTNLNDGTGIELRQDFKAAGVSVPVIYMTGNEDPAVRTAALNSGCIAFLIKPFSVQALMELKKASAGRS